MKLIWKGILIFICFAVIAGESLEPLYAGEAFYYIIKAAALYLAVSTIHELITINKKGE